MTKKIWGTIATIALWILIISALDSLLSISINFSVISMLVSKLGTTGANIIAWLVPISGVLVLLKTLKVIK